MNVTSIEVFPRRHRQTASGSALVARYNADGTADETEFDTSALTVAQAVAIQPVAARAISSSPDSQLEASLPCSVS